MYDISLSVSACARSGTRADVAVMLAPVVSDDALAFTPGGGRIGQLMGGAFDGLLADVAERKLSSGRRLRHTVNVIESSICGLETGTEVEFLIVPAEQFPAEIWPRLLAREAVTFTAALDDDVVTSVSLVSSVDQEAAAPDPLTVRLSSWRRTRSLSCSHRSLASWWPVKVRSPKPLQRRGSCWAGRSPSSLGPAWSPVWRPVPRRSTASS